MNMPEDVYDDLVWCLNWVNLAGEEGDCKVARRVLDWLDAQPAMPEPRWEPVDRLDVVRCTCGECDRWIEHEDGLVTISDDDGERLSAELPANMRICRLVEPGTEAGE